MQSYYSAIYIPPTSNNGPRIKVKNLNTPESYTIDYDYQYNTKQDQIEKVLGLTYLFTDKSTDYYTLVLNKSGLIV